MRRILGLLLLLEAFALAQPTPASVQQARLLSDKGTALMLQMSYEGACDAFTKSLALNAVFTTQLKLADCQEHLGRLAAAWQLYEEVATTSTIPEQTSFAREHADKLLGKLATLLIKLSDPSIDGTVVKVNGESVEPAAKIKAMVDPGEIEVEVDVPGRKPDTRTVMAEPGEHVQIVFERRQPLHAASSQGLKRPAVASDDDQSVTPPRDSDHHTRIVAAKSLMIGGGALLVIGAGIGLYEYNAYNQEFSSNGPCMNKSMPVCTDKSGENAINHAISGANVATVFGALGVAAAGVGAVLYFTTPGDVAFAPTVSGDGAGISISGAF
jgi:hypothetical protein